MKFERILRISIKAERTSNWDLHLKAISEMFILFAANNLLLCKMQSILFTADDWPTKISSSNERLEDENVHSIQRTGQ